VRYITDWTLQTSLNTEWPKNLDPFWRKFYHFIFLFFFRIIWKHTLTVEERMTTVSAQVQGLSYETVRHTITLYSFWSNSAVKLTVPTLRYNQNTCTCNDNKYIWQPVKYFNSFIRMDDHCVKKKTELIIHDQHTSKGTLSQKLYV
jgi:hypothetical protein